MKYLYQSLKLDSGTLKCLGMIEKGKETFYKNHFSSEGQTVIITQGYKGDRIPNEKNL